MNKLKRILLGLSDRFSLEIMHRSCCWTWFKFFRRRLQLSIKRETDMDILYSNFCIAYSFHYKKNCKDIEWKLLMFSYKSTQSFFKISIWYSLSVIKISKVSRSTILDTLAINSIVYPASNISIDFFSSNKVKDQ